MTRKQIINVPVNRIEGDLEIKVSIEDGQITDAWSSGLMYRGFERIMIGRGALDGLVITPRICGICTTAHLLAAALALDHIHGVTILPDALRIRNLALMIEEIQSDMRHAFLMYAVDFANPAYKNMPLYEEAVRRFQPLKGEAVIEVLHETKKITGAIAIIGGQWPHSSYMVPGGIVGVPAGGELLQCRILLNQYRSWYERRILGCCLERWAQVRSLSDLNAWLDESDAHRDSHLGFFIRFARAAGLDCIGTGYANFLSFGAFDLPEGTGVKGTCEQNRLVPSGFAQNTKVEAFDQTRISEHITYSWYNGDKNDVHPFDGETSPYASGLEGDKYSWAKAPRYNGEPVETGPLAEMIMRRDPLFTDLVQENGPTAFVRQLARMTRPVFLIPAMRTWISETTPDGIFYSPPGDIVDGQGFGLTNVTRGALGHWVKIKDGRIEHYQIITPTAWNGSPRDSAGRRGPWEQALIGTPIKDTENPVELGHVIRSFDACLVCTVHTVTL